MTWVAVTRDESVTGTDRPGIFQDTVTVLRMDPTEFLDGGRVTVPATTYAVCRTEQAEPDAFATVRDDTETTVVVEQDSPIATTAADVERGWKRLSFDMDLPFELVGFLGVVATALADVDVSVFVLSAYSTDHVFVKEPDLDAAARRLETLGCTVERA